MFEDKPIWCKEEEKKQLREEGKNVPQAKHEGEAKEPSYEPKKFREGNTEAQKKEAYIKI